MGYLPGGGLSQAGSKVLISIGSRWEPPRNGDFRVFTTHHSRPLSGAADAAEVVEGQGGGADAVVVEVELHRMPAWRQRLGSFPVRALQVDQVPEEYRPSLQQLEAVVGEAAAGGEQHAVPAGGDAVGAVEQDGGIAMWGSPTIGRV